MIVAVAVPAITNEFNSIEDIGWYGSAYMLTGACFTPIFGRLYQIYSTKWTFLTSIAIFEVGSAVCGAAPNSIALVIGRAISGLGSGGIFSGGMMLFQPLVPLRKRPTYAAIFGMAFGVSSVLGPIVGGSLTDHVYVAIICPLISPTNTTKVMAVVLLYQPACWRLYDSHNPPLSPH
jgi:MFS family permease